jgi:hypothetical protein
MKKQNKQLTPEEQKQFHLKLQEEMRKKLTQEKTKGVKFPSKAFDYINIW